MGENGKVLSIKSNTYMILVGVRDVLVVVGEHVLLVVDDLAVAADLLHDVVQVALLELFVYFS